MQSEVSFESQLLKTQVVKSQASHKSLGTNLESNLKQFESSQVTGTNIEKHNILNDSNYSYNECK